jgi:hypothetical protein
VNRQIRIAEVKQKLKEIPCGLQVQPRDLNPQKWKVPRNNNNQSTMEVSTMPTIGYK